jgi:hypothetical protein
MIAPQSHGGDDLFRRKVRYIGAMSALGQKQTSPITVATCALPPKTDIAERDIKIGVGRAHDGGRSRFG